jgi:outer membrane murein-binding lipoprotein Lpp
MENGEETFASPTAAAAADFEISINGGDSTPKLHNLADEMEALRAAKRDLEEKLDAVGHENRFLSSESRRLEVLVSQAREEVAAAEQVAATKESEAATLRAEVERLQGLLAAEKARKRRDVIPFLPGPGRLRMRAWCLPLLWLPRLLEQLSRLPSRWSCSTSRDDVVVRCSGSFDLLLWPI